jgi:hypothetical protein
VSLDAEWLERLGDADDVDLAAVPEFAPELVTAFTPVGFSLRFEEGSYLARAGDGVRVVVDAALVPEEERYADVEGAISREIDTSAGTAEHSQLFIPPRWQGDRRNRARRLTQTSARLYDELGVQQVTTYAQGAGRYVWATVGFDFYDDADRDETVGAAETFSSALKRPRDLSAIRHAWELAALEVESDELPVTLGEIAARTSPETAQVLERVREQMRASGIEARVIRTAPADASS